MYRFFVSPELIQGEEILFPSDLAHQLQRVLRLRVGDRVLVLDGSGDEKEVELLEFERRAVRGRILSGRPNQNEPPYDLTLYCALLKGRKMEWVLQKGTELGVARFVPMLTARSVVGSLQAVSEAKLDRWEAIVREAAEQSGRGRLPRIAEARLLEAALAEARDEARRLLIPWEQEAATTLHAALDGLAPPPRLALFIGPEGGFERAEVDAAVTYGAQPVTLGPLILRAETAAIAVAAAIGYALGGWGARKGGRP